MAVCECEQVSQSEHPSPGVVAAGETMLRLVYLPDEIDDHGCLKPTAIEKKDLVRQDEATPPERGFSMNRQHHLDSTALEKKALEHQAKKPELRAEGWVFTTGVDDIRALVDQDGGRAFCVVDRAELDDLSHAECWGAKPGRGEGQLRRIRAHLAAALSKGRRVI